MKANPSVTALSPRWRYSKARSGQDVCEVLGVAGLVEQHAEVVLAALRQHAQVDLVRARAPASRTRAAT